MKQNVGGVDRVVRIVLGLLLVFPGYQYSIWLAVIGAILLATGVVGWCGLYKVFGISTKKEAQ